MEHYESLYTWSHPLGDDQLAHQDGAVSTFVSWSGIDAEMLTTQQRGAAWSSLYTTLDAIGPDHCAEFHWWRERDDAMVDAYRARGEQMVRGGEFAKVLRNEMANHLAPYTMRNRVGLVLTRLPQRRWFRGARGALIDQAQLANHLRMHANALAAHLPGGHVTALDTYFESIQQSYDRAAFLRGDDVRHDPRYLVSEQRLREAPKVDNNCVVVGEQHTKVLLVYLYPDADQSPGLFFGLSDLSIPMHVVHIVQPINTKSSLKASERASDFAAGAVGHRGRDTQLQKVGDLAAFRSYVTENNLSIFKNTLVIHLHGDSDELIEYTRLISTWIGSQGGQVRDAGYVQLPYFRAAQPGQGYRVPIFRTDHTWQIANMLPVQVYREGDVLPESLRLGHAGQAIGFGLTNEDVSHSFTIAMTNGGKTVEKAATIVETYPFGIDWMIAEISPCQKWIVEGFGGVYSSVDPRESVINPLPPYATANPHAKYPLDAVQAGGTINALAFLLTDGRTQLTVHETAAGQHAMQALYSLPSDTEAPTLPDFLIALETAKDMLESKEQRDACYTMSSNLHSFLDTTEGRVFARPDNLILSPGITGVDLKEVDHASPKLLKFYLVFLALKFNHLAFARRTPARVLLDELHKFIANAPEVMGRLISELARMGRKDAAAIDIVTQNMKEVDAIETEVINSMRLRTLMYRPDEHDKIAVRIGMPAGPLALWKSFVDPDKTNWRPALRSVGPEYYNLHLTFPSMMLDVSASSPTDLALKDVISAKTRDPFERLALFKEQRNQRSAAA